MKPSMSLMDPQLQIFVTVAKCKSIHAASRIVHLTQTTITRRIQSLEQRLRTTLFVRSRQGVFLTTEGEALLRYCLTLQEAEGDALAHIQGAGIETTVKLCISGPTSIMTTRIIPSCYPLFKKYPNMTIKFDINNLSERISTLQQGISQFVIIEPKHTLKEIRWLWIWGSRL